MGGWGILRNGGDDFEKGRDDIAANEFGFFTLAHNCCRAMSKYAGKRQSISIWLPFTFAKVLKTPIHLLLALVMLLLFDLQAKFWIYADVLDPNLSMISINYSYKRSLLLLFIPIKFLKLDANVLKIICLIDKEQNLRDFVNVLDGNEFLMLL